MTHRALGPALRVKNGSCSCHTTMTTSDNPGCRTSVFIVQREIEREREVHDHNVMHNWMLRGLSGVKRIKDQGLWRINTTYVNVYDVMGVLRHREMVGAGSRTMYKQTETTAACCGQSFHFRQQDSSPEATHLKEDWWVMRGSRLDKYLRKKWFLSNVCHPSPR